jgi:hypothetical protein
VDGALAKSSTSGDGGTTKRASAPAPSADCLGACGLAKQKEVMGLKFTAVMRLVVLPWREIF